MALICGKDKFLLFCALLLLISSISSSVSGHSVKNSVIDELKIFKDEGSPTKRTLATTSTSNKDSFDTCRCDLTTNSCDAYCCCDDDCNSDIKRKWEKNDRQCRYEGDYSESILGADECYDRTTVGSLTDLQYGLNVYSNNLRSFLCVTFTRDSNPQEFINQDFGIENSEDFNKELEDAEDDFSAPLEATTSTVPDAYSLGTSLYLSSDKKFKLPLPNTFGLCDEFHDVKFMENINSTQCTRVTKFGDCQTNLKAETYTGASFNSLIDDTAITVTAGTIWVVTESDLSISTATTTFQTTSATCEYVLKEIHYTAYVNDDATAISSITADVVYMNLETKGTDEIVTLEQTFSFTFKQSELSRVQSGSPGYVKGYPIMAGKLHSTYENFIDANEGGFQLYGVDNSGDCLMDPTANTKYYTDPVLNFVDEAMYGCKVSKTASELSTFCSDSGDYNKIVLFDNIATNLKYVGIYGNANPHFINDWIEVEIDDISTDPAISGRSCTFVSAYRLIFYLTKLGTDDNPQLKITRAVVTPVRLTWNHDLIDPTAQKDFHVLLSVSFQEVPQDKSEFMPTPPNRLPKLNRNVLYPFFLFDD